MLYLSTQPIRIEKNSALNPKMVLFMLIYPRSIENASREKIEKYLYPFIHSNYWEVSYLSTVYSDLNDAVMPTGYGGLKTGRWR
jgi:hypothetical protein